MPRFCRQFLYVVVLWDKEYVLGFDVGVDDLALGVQIIKPLQYLVERIFRSLKFE